MKRTDKSVIPQLLEFGVVFALVVGVMFLFCALPTRPDNDPYYGQVTLSVPSPASGHSFSVGDTVSATLRFTNCRFITEVQLTAGDFLDTTLRADFCDSVVVPIILKSVGSLPITVSILRTNKSRIESTTQITAIGSAPVIGGTSVTQLSVREGQPCTLWVSARGVGPLTYSWSRNGSAITGEGRDTLILPAMNSSLAGTYLCTVRNPWDSVSSPELKIELLAGNAPSAPANLTRMKVEDGMMLVWDAVQGADRYLIFRDTVAQTSVTSFTQTTNSYLLVPDPGTFYYWVRASREGVLSPPSRVIFTGVSKPVWKTDSVTADLTEGDSARVPLMGSVSYADNLSNLRFSLLDPSGKGAVRDDSFFVFYAGRLDSGLYRGQIVVTDGASPDTCAFVVRVSPKYHTITVLSASNGSVTLTPPGPGFRWGDTVLVSAVAEAGYEFFRWIGDLSGIGATMKFAVSADRTIGAEFVAARSCAELAPGANINAAILEASRSSNRLEKLCPAPGRYDDGRLLIGGRVVLVVQK